MQNRDLQNIEVKEGRGRVEYVTYPSGQAMRNRSNLINNSIEDWCEQWNWRK